ncbi:Cohesin domain-containing protein [Methanophagales archaeon]|nr:Cohesin domain-containing protein [Methanophagales archaeon]
MAKKEKYRRNVLARGIAICIAAAIICLTLAIPGLAAEQTGDAVTATVDAPEVVNAGETFNVSIDVANITDFNSAPFDLSFDSSVVNVTGIADGSLDGATIPVSTWEFVDADTLRVLVSMPMGEGVSGSGYLAKVSFDVVGKIGDRSVLDISNGLLANKDAAEILALWIDDEVVIGDSSA